MATGERHPGAAIHCVLWHAPEVPPTPELTSLLVQRGVTLETCVDAFGAAARVCRLERAARRAERPASDGSGPNCDDRRPSTRGIVLLLAEPSRLSMRDGVARVLELHAPRTVCWVYEVSDGPRLRSVPLSDLATLGGAGAVAQVGSTGLNGASGDAPAPSGRAGASGAPSTRAPVRLTLTSSEGHGAPGEPAESARTPVNTGSVLTDEELAMLLSDDDPPPSGRRTTSQDPPRSQRQ